MKKQCPDDEILADYMEGRLSAKDRLFLEAHLSDCDACLENLVIGKAMEQNTEQLEPVPLYLTRSAMHLVDELNTPLIEKTGRAVRKICTTISDYLVPDFQNTHPLGVIRGMNHTDSDKCRQVIKDFKGIKTKIEFENTYSNQEQLQHTTIRISLISQSTDSEPTLRVSLKKGERELSSYLLNQKHILFEEIPPGEYHLIFTKDRLNIGEYVFTNRP